MDPWYTGPTSDNLANIPQALINRDQWVLWRGDDRVDPVTGRVKLNKIPINPITLTHADSTDPLTWGSFAQCVAAIPLALEEWETTNPHAYRGGGIGYVFDTSDPYVGIDLDGCVDGVTGALAPWAQAYVDQSASYTEITPSGTGLHILLEGTLPPRGRRKGQVEMYDYARFFTVTGWHLMDTPRTIEARAPQLAALWCALFGATLGQTVWLVDEQGVLTNHDGKPWAIVAIASSSEGEPYAFFAETTTGWPLIRCTPGIVPQRAASLLTMDDGMVMRRMTSAGNKAKVERLGTGQWQPEYTSQSEADLAFCCLLAFWTRDPMQMDRLFRTTGLMRAKWEEKRGTQTYGERTIVEALARQHEHYTPGNLTTLTLPQPRLVPSGAMDFSKAISATDLLTMQRIPARFLVPKLIADGLNVLAAPAKSYKSYFALSLALATIGEGDWCETFPVEDTGPVVFFGLEAPPMQLRNRLFQLRPNFDPRTAQHALIFFSGMRCLPTFREGLQVAVEEVIAHYRPRLIVIDPLSYLYRLGRQDDLASATLDLLWPLAEMASEHRVALLAAEHMRKRSKEDVSVVDQLAGSHIKGAIVHGLLMLHKEGEDLIIETTMRDAPAQEMALTITFDPLEEHIRWGYKGANATLGASRIASTRGLVLAELQARGYPMKVAELIQNLALPNTESTKSNVRLILSRAEKDGDVAMSKRGEYYWIGH
jgi:putative DNA primase/helicase